MIHFPPNRVFENRYQDVPSSGGSLIPGRLRHSRLTSNRIDVSSTKPEVQAKLSDAQKCSRSSARNGWPYFPSLACGADWGYPEFPKKFWKGASYATGHWYNRTSPVELADPHPGPLPRGAGDCGASRAVLFLNLGVGKLQEGRRITAEFAEMRGEEEGIRSDPPRLSATSAVQT